MDGGSNPAGDESALNDGLGITDVTQDTRADAMNLSRIGIGCNSWFVLSVPSQCVSPVGLLRDSDLRRYSAFSHTRRATMILEGSLA